MNPVFFAVVAAFFLAVTAIWAFGSDEHEIYALQCVAAVAAIPDFSCDDGRLFQ